jgi:hypothetical protein
MTKLMHLEQSTDSLQCEDTTPITSSAAALIQIAAYRIDLPHGTLERILDRLGDECIKEEWQLKFMDSYNWQALGAPIGLVAAVRSCLQGKTASTGTSSCSSSLDRCVSDETPKFVPATTQISWSTCQTAMLSSSPATTRARELRERHSVPIFPSSRRSDGGVIPSEPSHSVPIQRNSMPDIPARRNTILVDDALFEKLNALDLYDSFVYRSTKDFLTPPQIPQRRASNFVMSSNNSLDISDLFETDDDDDASVDSLCGL